ncbi:MAG: VWA domain-containing protein [Novosphingobium sp.]|nr:VWA domain-containing protein [Novosphingobium sp.]
MRNLTIVSTAALALTLAGCATRPSGSEEIVLTGAKAGTAEQGAADAGDESASIVVAGRTAGSQAPPPPPAPHPPGVMSTPVAPSSLASSTSGFSLANKGGPRRYVPSVIVPADPGRERYDGKGVSPVQLAASDPVSTFSVDVDTGAYANSRRFLSQGQLPPRDAVRSEELINYFRYDYPLPATREAPFSVTSDVAATPWNPATRLLRIGLRGYDLPRASRPPANLVFLVDVSGSMASSDKLPLVKTALAGLADELSPRDKVSIVVYAGAAGLVLPASGDKREIVAALDRLSAGGSTAGGAGLQLAYQVARDNFIKGGVNRILLATDGDFNVGVSDSKALIAMVVKERDAGVTLTTLGFGQGNYNEAMMEQVADHGNGNYAYIDSALEARKVLAEQMSSTLFTIAKDVKIQVEFNPAKVAQYRLLGYENRALREEDFNNDKVDAGDIGAGHQVTAIYEIVPVGAKGWIEPRRYGDAAPVAAGRGSELAFVKLRYKLPDGTTSKLIERAIPATMLANARAPSGDMAFATAVAAFGQKLRGDPLLGELTYAGIAGLASGQRDYYRQEFAKLVAIAGSLDTRVLAAAGGDD